VLRLEDRVRHELTCVLVGQPIEHSLTLLARGHKTRQAELRQVLRNGARRPWLVQLLARRTPKVAAVALANKNARMVWAIMTSGERYREPVAA